MRIPARLLWLMLCLAGARAAAQAVIHWNSAPNQTNRTSTDGLLDDGFQFELGVFSAGFTPMEDNVAQWSANWHAAARTGYLAAEKRFVASHEVYDNTAPFLAGTAAYVWGFGGDGAHGEWILFRASNWLWPVGAGVPMPPIDAWSASAATTVVLGSIDADGSPWLMKTKAVAAAAPPVTTWEQWQGQYLDGEVLDQPEDDPDRDGTSNLLEYVFGTRPRSAGAPPVTPVAVADGHLEITIPRRVDRPAGWVVEVSDDLEVWQSGAGHTVVVSDTSAALVVRDLTTLGPARPRRFVRVKVQLETP